MGPTHYILIRNAILLSTYTLHTDMELRFDDGVVAATKSDAQGEIRSVYLHRLSN